MIGQGGRTGEEILKGGLFDIFPFLAAAIAGIEVFLEILPEINLVKGVFGFALWLGSGLFGRGCRGDPVAVFFASGDLIQQRHSGFQLF